MTQLQGSIKGIGRSKETSPRLPTRRAPLGPREATIPVGKSWKRYGP